MGRSVKICGMVPWVFYLVLGIILAPALSLPPILKRSGWIFTAIIHEGGHTIYSLFVGCPAFPRISLLGNAATTTQQQYPFLCILLFCCMGYGLYKIWEYPFWRYLLIVLLVFYPFLVINSHLKEWGHLLSGHLGELLIAGIFTWRAVTGIATGGEIDRAAYGVMGWYLIIHNAYLCFGIAYIPAVRTWYYDNGSYGLVNDYIRVAGSIGIDIKVVALSMMLISIAVAPIAIMLAKLGDDIDGCLVVDKHPSEEEIIIEQNIPQALAQKKDSRENEQQEIKDLSLDDKVIGMAKDYCNSNECLDYYSKKSSFTKGKAGEWKAKEVDDFTYLVDFKTDKELYSFEVDFNTGIVSDVWADPRLRGKYGNRKDEDPKKKSPIFKFKE